MQKIGIYTTIYPGVEEYLRDWYRSVRAQTDQDFQLWIGLDGIEPSAVKAAIGEDVDAVWVPSAPDHTPARVRQRSLAQMVDRCDAVVLVDSDDILHPTRVAAARSGLQAADLAACALRLVDRQGKSLGKTLTIPERAVPESILPRTNVFGFSNSAYRSELLRQCLPIPPDGVLMDWFLATRAWLMGARLVFDSAIRMDYRQYQANTAPICFPFDAKHVAQNTRKVLDHYRLLLASPLAAALPDRLAQVEEAGADVRLFFDQVVSRPERLENYVRNLNCLKPESVWWWDVAQPELRWIWKSNAGASYEGNSI